MNATNFSSPHLLPLQVWEEMLAGNERFIQGTPLHPRQDAEQRTMLAQAQTPRAAILGCSDSRLAAEIIFDLGLGDAFVVRNAGQVVSSSALGTLEYAVSALHIPLILVLGHDSCGAVQAAIESYRSPTPVFSPHIHAHIEHIFPAITEVIATCANLSEDLNPSEIGRIHLRGSAEEIVNASPLIRNALENNQLAIVAANYKLHEGHVEPVFVLDSTSS